MKSIFVLVLLLLNLGAAYAQEPSLTQTISEIEPKLIEWRRDFHSHPELGNQEVRTSRIIAAHLKTLGMNVQEHVAKTGVIGILIGDLPGPVMALRADMDALPVTERTPLDFKSDVKVNYKGNETGVMHACGHDSHMAILMATAEVLSKHKKDIRGTVKFIFQPAEEGVFGEGIEFGADLMVKEGALRNPDVEVIFGLHIDSKISAGKIAYRPGPIMAGVDQFYIDVKGKQTHGARPWAGIDPISAASQIVLGLNTIVSRSVDLVENPAVVSVGSIHGGNRHNIIPEEVKLVGTIRTLDPEQRVLVHRRIIEVAENIAKSAGAEATVFIENGYPVTVNDEALTKKMLPSLEKAIGQNLVFEKPITLGAEDFSYFAREVPGFFFFLGGRESDKNSLDVAAHHTPDFFLDESGFINGVKAFCQLIVDYPNK
ncbi:MAG: amidohydrolase [Arcticibacterium sp.]|jgi:amidohydrolase